MEGQESECTVLRARCKIVAVKCSKPKADTLPNEMAGSSGCCLVEDEEDR